MQFSTVIFDYDGVLADNHDFNFLACKVAAADCGITITESEYLQHFYPGQTLKTGALNLLSKYNKAALIDNFIAIKTSQDHLYHESVVPVPGAIEFVNWCYDHKLQLAIGSGARRTLIDKYLAKYQLTDKFKLIITADDVSFSKPHPETYLKVLHGLKIQPNEAIIIEDSVAGISAGQSAGCKVVGLVSTSAAEKLVSADFVANSYQEIPDLIS